MTTCRVILCVACVVLAACGTEVTYTSLRSAPTPMKPKSGEQVEVFMSQKPERAFVEVGMVESQQRNAGIGADDTSEILAKMRDEAGQQGCDGLILMGSNDAVIGSGYGGPGYGGGMSVNTKKGYRASCIVFTGAASPSVAPQSPPPNAAH